VDRRWHWQRLSAFIALRTTTAGMSNRTRRQRVLRLSRQLLTIWKALPRLLRSGVPVSWGGERFGTSTLAAKMSFLALAWRLRLFGYAAISGQKIFRG
jgi:hypothetical protein